MRLGLNKLNVSVVGIGRSDGPIDIALFRAMTGFRIASAIRLTLGTRNVSTVTDVPHNGPPRLADWALSGIVA